jgi:AcrR family transcriptional regulator
MSAIMRVPYAEAARNLMHGRVLGAVDELIGHDGWAATSIAKVTKYAGVSRQTIYNEFGSRQLLAQAYVLYRLDRILDVLDEKVLANRANVETGLARGWTSCSIGSINRSSKPPSPVAESALTNSFRSAKPPTNTRPHEFPDSYATYGPKWPNPTPQYSPTRWPA